MMPRNDVDELNQNGMLEWIQSEKLHTDQRTMMCNITGLCMAQKVIINSPLFSVSYSLLLLLLLCCFFSFLYIFCSFVFSFVIYAYVQSTKGTRSYNALSPARIVYVCIYIYITYTLFFSRKNQLLQYFYFAIFACNRKKKLSTLFHTLEKQRITIIYNFKCGNSSIYMAYTLAYIHSK